MECERAAKRSGPEPKQAGESSGEDQDQDQEPEPEPEPSVSGVSIRYKLPFGGTQEHSVDLSFEDDEVTSSKTEEKTHELDSSESFVRAFVAAGHKCLVSVSYNNSGELVEREEVVELSGFLVGDKAKRARLRFEGPLRWVKLHLQLEKEREPEPEPEAEGDGAEEAEGAAGEAEAGPTHLPCGLLTPDLVDLLNPFVFEISQLESLPDRPASTEQLDDLCEPVSVRYTFFDTTKLQEGGEGDDHGGKSQSTPLGYGGEEWHRGLRSLPWRENEVGTMCHRDVEVGSARVYFLGDCDEDEIFKHFFYDKIPVEVHDRLPCPEDMKIAAAVPTGGSGEGGEGQGEGAEEDAPNAAGGSAQAQEDERKTYVCGLSHISLREFCMGYTSYDNSVNIFPYTSIRGGADLDWKTRPGRYVESGAQVTYSCRVAKSLKEAGTHRYFQRAVFLLDYDDNVLLRSIIDLVTAVNRQALKLKGSSALVLQTLATYKFDEEQSKSTTLDVLTGFQIIDDRMRLIVVEGLKQGAMAHVRDLIEATTSSAAYLEERKHKKEMEFTAKDFEKGSVTKHLLYNPALCYSKRLYTQLGAQIHPIKLSAPLAHIMANCHTHSGRKVREQCREGLIRLSNLCRITWLRQADRMQLLPTSSMLKYIDKKFGGELTRLDEEGEVGGQHGGLGGTAKAGDFTLTSVLASAKKDFNEETSRSLKSSGTKSDQLGGRARYSYSKPHLDFDNKAFEIERARRDEKRKKRDFLEEYINLLPAMETMASGIRDEWFAWNPQRLRRARSPLQKIRTVKAFQSASPKKPGQQGAAHKEGEAGTTRPDDRPEFIFPAPKSPWEYNAHPKRPTKARIEELEQSWIENEFYGSLMRYDDETDIVPFKTIMPAPAILEKNKEFFTSVHLCGEGLIKEQEAAKQQEIDKWNSKVVVDDPHFYSIIKSRKKVSQTDRNELTLKGSPIKKGFKIAHAKALPTSMHINVPYEEGDQTYFQRQVDPSKFTGGNDFVRYIRDGDPSKANASMTALTFVKKLHTARKKSIMSRLQTPQK